VLPLPGVRLGRHISTFQVSEFNTKTAKLASFCQSAIDPGPAALPKLASTRQIHARHEPSPPGRELSQQVWKGADSSAQHELHSFLQEPFLRIKKAVITAAGQNQRTLPLQTLIDRDGQEKPVLRILIEQALAANVDQICVVIWPGDESRYAQAAGKHAGGVRFIPQPQPLGYGHAIHCAREFTGADPFLHMVGDHLYVTDAASEPSARRLVELAQAEECSVSGVQATRESLLPRFGTVAGRRVSGRSDLYRIDTVIEKPTPTEAEQRLMVPGIRAGYYLCFFGVHVLTPAVMDILGRMLSATFDDPVDPVTLAGALAELSRHEQYLALEDDGRRYDLGPRYGLLVAQLALALAGQDRAQVLSQMLELLADRELTAASGGSRR
jgi:UTP--glucose-1-phosphate uridylyltransferase